MQNIKQVIVPVDFHQHTEDLAEFAIGIANKLDAKLIFIHVATNIVESAVYTDVYPTAFEAIDKELLGFAQTKMNALVEKSKGASPECAGQVLRGEAADAIVDYVNGLEDALIIMGTHGAKGIEKIMLGSVAERVLKRASCPILVFNPYKGERGYQITVPLSEAVQPV